MHIKTCRVDLVRTVFAAQVEASHGRSMQAVRRGEQERFCSRRGSQREMHVRCQQVEV